MKGSDFEMVFNLSLYLFLSFVEAGKLDAHTQQREIPTDPILPPLEKRREDTTK
jgi:hypothetical protein